MADDLGTGTCRGGSLWNPARSIAFDMPVTASCSTMISDMGGGGGGGGGFSWAAPAELVDGKARSCDESPVSASSVTFQDARKLPRADAGSSNMMDSSLQLPVFSMGIPSMDWSQGLMNSARADPSSFHAMLQEELSTRALLGQYQSMESNQVHSGIESSMNPIRGTNSQSFLLDHQNLNSDGNESGDAGVSSYTLAQSPYGCLSPVLQGIYEAESKAQLQPPVYDNWPATNNYQSPMMAYRDSSNELLQSSWPKLSQLLKSSPPKQQPSGQLQFSNNTPFWNATAAASISEVSSGSYSAAPSPLVAQVFEQKNICSNPTVKTNSNGVRDSYSSSSKKPGAESAAFKKPRIETPSPLPTFKVRKEKLGDRITALQQLVSPFGKTDTASVLHEAIEYIKFLHDQVGVLSTPYLKNGHSMQHQQGSDKSKEDDGPKQDLRSRGLCLVPIASTYPVASETTADFWHPTFGGSFR